MNYHEKGVNIMGGRGSKSGMNARTGGEYKRGGSTYTVTSDSNGNLYMRIKTDGLIEEYKISYADNPNRMRITVPGFGVVRLRDDPNLIELVQRAKKNK